MVIYLVAMLFNLFEGKEVKEYLNKELKLATGLIEGLLDLIEFEVPGAVYVTVLKLMV